MKSIPIKKSLSQILVEQAHGGSGSRQVIFSKNDNVSPQFEAWTKGYLPVGSSYDWHFHENVDEFFIVLKGKGFIEYEDGTKFKFKKGDVMYNPAGMKHRIENTDKTENEFYFIRLND